MDWGKTLGKGGKDFVVTSLAVAAAAVLSYLADGEHAKAALSGFPMGLRDVLVPVLSSLAVMALNWLKHRDSPSDEKPPGEG